MAFSGGKREILMSTMYTCVALMVAPFKHCGLVVTHGMYVPTYFGEIL